MRARGEPIYQKMDALLGRLQSIKQSFKHVNTLSADQEQKILKRLLDIYEKLHTIEECNDDSLKTLWDDLFLMLSEIESMLYMPIVSHLITQLKIKRQEMNYDNELRVQHAECVCKFQESNVKENFAKASPCELLDDQSIKGITDDYWTKRKDRVYDLLDDTSLRFDKSCLKRRKQKSLLWDPYTTETNVELCNADVLKMSLLPRSSKKPSQSEKYSQESIDTFWGLREDHCKDKDKKWKVGEVICVLNCKSELKKLQVFLKEKKPVRSFYVQRKPRGLAGCKGTWLTPPYSPPLVVKYGHPIKPSSK